MHFLLFRSVCLCKLSYIYFVYENLHWRCVWLLHSRLYRMCFSTWLYITCCWTDCLIKRQENEKRKKEKKTAKDKLRFSKSWKTTKERLRQEETASETKTKHRINSSNSLVVWKEKEKHTEKYSTTEITLYETRRDLLFVLEVEAEQRAVWWPLLPTSYVRRRRLAAGSGATLVNRLMQDSCRSLVGLEGAAVKGGMKMRTKRSK